MDNGGSQGEIEGRKGRKKVEKITRKLKKTQQKKWTISSTNKGGSQEKQKKENKINAHKPIYPWLSSNAHLDLSCSSTYFL